MGAWVGDSKTWNFNPLPPHGGRRTDQISRRIASYFNPLPPHGGRRQRILCRIESEVFQSTPSAWRETLLVY